MGYDLIAVVMVAFLTPFVILGFILYWVMTHRARHVVEGAWEGYARARSAEGLVFEPAAGEWPNRTSPALVWASELGKCRLLVMGREATAHTRIVIRPRSTVLGECVVVVRDAATIEVRGNAARLFDERLKNALLAFCHHEAVSLAYRRGKVIVEWRGRELSASRLDEARALAAEAAGAIDRAFRDPAERAA